MHYVGTCPKCQQGLLGVRVCSGEERHTVILCDECDALWKTPETSKRATYPEQPSLPCPECGESLRNDPAHWATLREIRRHGWEKFIAGSLRRRAT